MTFSKYRYKLLRQSLPLRLEYQEPGKVAGDRLDDIDKPSEPDSGLSRFPHNSASVTRSHRVNRQGSNPEEYIGAVRPPSSSPCGAPCRNPPFSAWVRTPRIISVDRKTCENLNAAGYRITEGFPGFNRPSSAGPVVEERIFF